MVTLNSRRDLEVLSPTHTICLDDTIFSVEPFLRLTLRMNPQPEQEVLDLMENFFQPLLDELRGKTGAPLAKRRIVEAIKDSTMSAASKE